MLPISQVMRREIPVLPPDAPVRGVVAAMMQWDVEGVLIVDRPGRVVGSIGDEQLVAALHARQPWWSDRVAAERPSWPEERLSAMASEVMLRRVVVMPPASPVSSAIALFDDRAVNVIAIVDRGALVGAAFRRDVIKRLLLRPRSAAPLGPDPDAARR